MLRSLVGSEMCIRDSIESIRTVGEVNALRDKGGFTLFAVDAQPEVRYGRILARKSATDEVSLDKFKADEQLEMRSDDPNKQNLLGCMQLADVRLCNDGGVDQLEAAVDQAMEALGVSV
eukprot:TRINITY_DN59995_c0_g1_i1.p1 TRINITY_DN59995_c0_g1~~TRINITY_DN59995_c0_g1_i1.p1  ORF type:complete len:119 (-),score=49.16 TRINITY_DN59995_c0_g1_i1:258-614(-)